MQNGVMSIRACSLIIGAVCNALTVAMKERRFSADSSAGTKGLTIASRRAIHAGNGARWSNMADARWNAIWTHDIKDLVSARRKRIFVETPVQSAFARISVSLLTTRSIPSIFVLNKVARINARCCVGMLN